MEKLIHYSGPPGYAQAGSIGESQSPEFYWINERVNSSAEQAKVIFEGLKAAVEEGEEQETPEWEQQVKNKVDEIRLEVNQGLDTLQADVTRGIRKLPQHKREEAGKWFVGLMGMFNTIIKVIMNAITGVWNWIKNTAERVWSTVKAIWNTVTGLFSS